MIVVTMVVWLVMVRAMMNVIVLMKNSDGDSDHDGGGEIDKSWSVALGKFRINLV